jgi:hypothetical protein
MKPLQGVILAGAFCFAYLFSSTISRFVVSLMLIWRGYGWFVLVIIFAAGCLGTALQPLAPAQLWPRCLAMALASATLLILGWLLNHPHRWNLDDAPLISDRNTHSFFWIDIEYWAAIVLVFLVIYIWQNV